VESVQKTFSDMTADKVIKTSVGEADEFTPVSEVASEPGDTLSPMDQDSVMRPPLSLTENNQGESVRSLRGERTLTFDLHPLYGAILQDGAQMRQGEVLGLDGDLRRVLVAPFDGVIRLLVTGTGAERRVRVFLSEQKDRRESFAAGRR
jgi:hypothetical protein